MFSQVMPSMLRAIAQSVIQPMNEVKIENAAPKQVCVREDMTII